MTSVYLAGPYAARALLLEMKAEIEDAGHTVTSSWLSSTRDITEDTVGPTWGVDDDTVLAHTLGDFADVDAAENILLVTGNYVRPMIPGLPEDWLHTGGRHVEFGYALAKGKGTFILGQPENVFARSMAFIYETLGEIVQHLTTGEVTVPTFL